MKIIGKAMICTTIETMNTNTQYYTSSDAFSLLIKKEGNLIVSQDLYIHKDCPVVLQESEVNYFPIKKLSDNYGDYEINVDVSFAFAPELDTESIKESLVGWIGPFPIETLEYTEKEFFRRKSLDDLQYLFEVTKNLIDEREEADDQADTAQDYKTLQMFSDLIKEKQMLIA